MNVLGRQVSYLLNLHTWHNPTKMRQCPQPVLEKKSANCITRDSGIVFPVFVVGKELAELGLN